MTPRVDGTQPHLMVVALRYMGTVVQIDSAWLVAERGLSVDWLEERPL